MTRSLRCILVFGAMITLPAGCSDPDPVGHAWGRYPTEAGPYSPPTPPPPPTTPPPESHEEVTVISVVEVGSRTVVKLGSGAIAAWSPDGSRIAFISDRTGTGNYQLYLIDRDGSDLVQLSSETVQYGVLAWSPDGSRIAFQSSTRNSDGSIRAIHADGSGQVALVTGGLTGSYIQSAAWSPDGREMLFTAYGSGSSRIYVVNADGSEMRMLDGLEAGDSDAAWSPDARSVVFVRDRSAECGRPPCSALFVLNMEGGAVRQLTSSENEAVSHPRWSPDGSTIAFTSFHGYDDWSAELDPTLQVIRPDGSGRKEILGSENWNGGASWSPDARRLLVNVYSSSIGSALISLPAAGGAAEMVAENAWGGSWSPDGRRVLFVGPR